MNLILYNSSAEQNRVNKTSYLSEIVQLTGQLRNQSSLVNPTIIIELNPQIIEQKILKKEYVVKSNPTDYVVDETPSRLVYSFISQVLSANYAEIPEFNRFYFITDIVSVRNNLWEISMTCDVLMSYKNDILNLPALVSRNEFIYNNYIADDKAPLQNNNEVLIENQGEIFDSNIGLDGKYLLVVNNNTTSIGIRGQINLPEPLQSLGAGSITSCRGFSIYLISDAAFQTLSSICFNNENYTTGIVACIALPFDIEPTSSNVTSPIRINGTQIQEGEILLAVGYDLSLSANSDLAQKCLVVTSGIFTISPLDNNFRAYEPYTYYSIYIPYLGWRDLNAVEVLYRNLQLVYIINPTSATANVFLISTYIYEEVTQYNIILNEECQLGVAYEFTVTNLKALEDQRLMLNSNLATSLISSGGQMIGGALTMGAGVVSESPSTVASGAGSMISGATNAINSAISYSAQMATLHNKANCTPSSGFNGTVSPQSILIKRARTIIPVYEDVEKLNKYLNLYGRPLNETYTLKELSGYTEILNIHLDNIPTATQSELRMIEQSLYSGFII